MNDNKRQQIVFDKRVNQIKISKDGWVTYLPIDMAIEFRNELNDAIADSEYWHGRDTNEDKG